MRTGLSFLFVVSFTACGIYTNAAAERASERCGWKHDTGVVAQILGIYAWPAVLVTVATAKCNTDAH